MCPQSCLVLTTITLLSLYYSVNRFFFLSEVTSITMKPEKFANKHFYSLFFLLNFFFITIISCNNVHKCKKKLLHKKIACVHLFNPCSFFSRRTMYFITRATIHRKREREESDTDGQSQETLLSRREDKYFIMVKRQPKKEFTIFLSFSFFLFTKKLKIACLAVKNFFWYSIYNG